MEARGRRCKQLTAKLKQSSENTQRLKELKTDLVAKCEEQGVDLTAKHKGDDTES